MGVACLVLLFKQKWAYCLLISDWSSDVCSADLLRPVEDTTPYEGKTMEFKVIKLARKRNNVVLSRRSVLEASMGEERQKLLETLSEGAVVKGVVKNITDYGAFVDLGGIDG